MVEISENEYRRLMLTGMDALRIEMKESNIEVKVLATEVTERSKRYDAQIEVMQEAIKELFRLSSEYNAILARIDKKLAIYVSLALGGLVVFEKILPLIRGAQ